MMKKKQEHNGLDEETPVEEENYADLPQEERKVSETDELQQKFDELNDRYLRLAADYDNFKKRSARDSKERIQYTVAQFAVEMLGIVDNLERALKSDDEKLREGLEQIHKQIIRTLEKHAITPIECINTPFDPVKQEAIAYVPSDLEEGTVIDEIIRGYCMDEKVIRHAKVAVSKGKNKED